MSLKTAHQAREESKAKRVPPTDADEIRQACASRIQKAVDGGHKGLHWEGGVSERVPNWLVEELQILGYRVTEEATVPFGQYFYAIIWG